MSLLKLFLSAELNIVSYLHKTLYGPDARKPVLGGGGLLATNVQISLRSVTSAFIIRLL